ncbi:MAG TPA: hypothetical protein PK014_09620 [Thermoanaerobaculia bacterium]|nr:hypothetical protein [Thermoanaerobaculia bacterium]HUM30081.1 hypothetical protein [Thermoanaerobaculia bacterium]HXK69423.1 hypothetical protein [Thermoanaerobaculia bacterium]
MLSAFTRKSCFFIIFIFYLFNNFSVTLLSQESQNQRPWYKNVNTKDEKSLPSFDNEQKLVIQEYEQNKALLLGKQNELKSTSERSESKCIFQCELLKNREKCGESYRGISCDVACKRDSVNNYFAFGKAWLECRLQDGENPAEINTLKMDLIKEKYMDIEHLNELKKEVKEMEKGLSISEIQLRSLTPGSNKNPYLSQDQTSMHRGNKEKMEAMVKQLNDTTASSSTSKWDIKYDPQQGDYYLIKTQSPGQSSTDLAGSPLSVNDMKNSSANNDNTKRVDASEDTQNEIYNAKHDDKTPKAATENTLRDDEVNEQYLRWKLEQSKYIELWESMTSDEKKQIEIWLMNERKNGTIGSIDQKCTQCKGYLGRQIMSSYHAGSLASLFCVYDVWSTWKLGDCTKCENHCTIIDWRKMCSDDISVLRNNVQGDQFYICDSFSQVGN